MQRSRTRRSLTTAENVGAHDEPLVRVDGETRTDRTLPPTRRRVTEIGRTGDVTVARPGVAHQDRVARVGVERSPRLVRDDDAIEHLTRVEGQLAIERQELPIPYRVGRTPGTRHGHCIVHLGLLSSTRRGR